MWDSDQEGNMVHIISPDNLKRLYGVLSTSYTSVQVRLKRDGKNRHQKKVGKKHLPLEGSTSPDKL